MQILIKIAFILLPCLVSAQISFYKQYADDGFDFGQGIVQLEDSSYAVTGASGSFASHAQAFLMFVDSAGIWKWSGHYGGQETDWGRRVLHKKNVGFYICGYSNSFGNGGYDFYLVKTDENGTEEWTKTYGGAGWDRAMDAVMTRDTGIVLVGERQNGAYGMDMYIVRTNIDGDTLWTHTFENPGDDIANAVDIYEDSILIVAGNHFYADSSQTKGIIYKITDSGVILDTLVFYDYQGDYEFNDVLVTGDTIRGVGAQLNGPTGNWALASYWCRTNTTGFYDLLLFREQLDGDWHGDGLTDYGNGDRVYEAFSFENNSNVYPGGRDAMIQKGNEYMFWMASVEFLAMEEPDVNGQIIRTNDGGAIHVGYHQNPAIGSGGGTIFLYKIGPNELYPVFNTTQFYSQLVSVKEVDASIDVSVYPNPANDFLNVELPTNESYDYQFLDASGKIVATGEVFGSGQIQLSVFQAGVYFLHVQNDRGSAINRIIIQ